MKWVYAIGFLVWSLATAAVGSGERVGGALVARLVLGIGESVAYPASSKIIVRHFPEERRGLANAVVDAGAKLGPGLSTLLGGLAVQSIRLARDVSCCRVRELDLARSLDSVSRN